MHLRTIPWARFTPALVATVLILGIPTMVAGASLLPGGSNESTILNQENEPSAVDDAVTTPFAIAVTIDVLANDTGADLEITDVSVPASGTAAVVVVSGVDQILYTPNAGFSGVDTFTYEITGGGLTDTAQVTVTVNANQPPVANSVNFTIDKNTTDLVPVLLNDSDPDGHALTITAVTDPANGTATIEGTQVRYTPGANFVGADAFSYTISDGHGGTASAVVNVTVVDPNRPPVAVDDSVETDVDTAILIDVLANDSDPDEDDVISIVSVTQPSDGTATIVGDQILYTPDAGFTGSDSFTYTIQDEGGLTDTATVTVEVVDGDENGSDETAAEIDAQVQEICETQIDAHPSLKALCRVYEEKHDGQAKLSIGLNIIKNAEKGLARLNVTLTLTGDDDDDDDDDDEASTAGGRGRGGPPPWAGPRR